MEKSLKVLRCGYNVMEPEAAYIDRPYGTGDFILILFLARMEVSIKRKTHIVEPGSAVIFTPECEETIRGKDSFYNSYAHFDGRQIMEFLLYLDIPLNTIVRPEKAEKLNELLKRLEAQMILKQRFWEDETEAVLNEILITLARNLSRIGRKEEDFEDVRLAFHKARIAIHTNPEKQWTVMEMAKLTGFGKTRFFYYYERFFGVSPKNDLTNARLERAKFLLTNKALTIRQIAANSGFENTCHFIRSFKKKYQASPTRYSGS